MSDSLAEKFLRDSKSVSEAEIKDLKAELKATHIPLSELILRHNILSEEKLAKSYAAELGLPYVRLAVSNLEPVHLRLMPENISRRYRAVVFDVKPDDTKLVATDNQLPSEVTKLLSKLLGDNYELFLSSPSQVHSALDVYRQLGVHHSDIVNSTVEDNPVERPDDPRIYKTVYHVIDQAIDRGASVIHIEPREDVIVVRFRIDGHLKEAYKIPIAVLAPLVTRIKLLAGLRPDINLSQSGRFRVESHNSTFSLDVVTLPMADGEKITLSIKNESLTPPTLPDIGFWGHNLKLANHVMTKRRGLILLSGPRDSGKTTMLYSLLSILDIGRVNATSIEDRLSFRVRGVNQIELGPSLPNYETAIESSLKQDPEILLVNEIISPMSANLVVNAAGNCLVLSSINGISSFGALLAIGRLGVQPYALAHNTQLVISSRLVRKLCEHCKKPVHPTTETMRGLVKVLGLANYGSIKDLHNLEKQAANDGLGGLEKTDLSTSETGIKRLWQANEHGCVHCDYSGFRGRTTIEEVLELTDDIKAKLSAGTDFSEIHKLAVKFGFIPLGIDGLVKALRGLTSIEEILAYI
jgi:type IV pilus assembly protein PilB